MRRAVIASSPDGEDVAGQQREFMKDSFTASGVMPWWRERERSTSRRAENAFTAEWKISENVETRFDFSNLWRLCNRRWNIIWRCYESFR